MAIKKLERLHSTSFCSSINPVFPRFPPMEKAVNFLLGGDDDGGNDLLNVCILQHSMVSACMISHNWDYLTHLRKGFLSHNDDEL